MVESASLFILGSFVVACSAKVARFPRPGESLRAEAFTLDPGGKGFNLAVGARRLGHGVDGLLPVGSDAFAAFAESAVARAGLPPAMLRRFEGATGAGIGFTDGRGENALAVFPGANRRLSAADAHAAAPAIRSSGMVLAPFEIEDGPIAAAFAIARGAGVPTLLNPSPFRMPDPAILERTSILVLNRVEAAAMAAALGLPATAGGDDMAAALLERGPELVVVTLGADGAAAHTRGSPTLHQPAFPVTPVDTLGAGDAFTAGLAAALAEGRPLPESLRRAAACGALVTRRLGVFDALPTRAELDAFAEHGR